MFWKFAIDCWRNTFACHGSGSFRGAKNTSPLFRETIHVARSRPCNSINVNVKSVSTVRILLRAAATWQHDFFIIFPENNKIHANSSKNTSYSSRLPVVVCWIFSIQAKYFCIQSRQKRMRYLMVWLDDGKRVWNKAVPTAICYPEQNNWLKRTYRQYEIKI